MFSGKTERKTYVDMVQHILLFIFRRLCYGVQKKEALLTIAPPLSHPLQDNVGQDSCFHNYIECYILFTWNETKNSGKRLNKTVRNSIKVS